MNPKKPTLLLSLVVASLLLPQSRLFAGPITPALKEPLAATVRTDVYPGAGYGFYPPLTGTVINRLGYWDQGGDGLLTSHDVMLVRYNGNSRYTEIARATIPAGTAAPLENGYRWVTIPNLSLPNLGQGADYYAILASHGQDPWTETLGTAVPMNDGIGTVVSSGVIPSTSALTADQIQMLGNRPGGWGGANLGYADIPFPADPPLRVMPVGDSITAGFTDNPTWNMPFEFGYRGPLTTLLKAAGFPFHFVGKSPEPFNNTSGDPTHGGMVYPVNELRDPNIDQGAHRGYGGQDIPFVTAHIADWIATDDPDVILLMIGTNNISSGSPAQLDTLVTTIFTAKPAVKLVVAQIIPQVAYIQDVVNYNTYIRNTLVPAYQAQGRNIVTVDQYKNFLTNPADNTSIDTSKFSNGINHPTNDAYQLMAATWFPALANITLSSATVASSGSSGTALATLSKSQATAGESVTFTLAAGAGDTDNSKFVIAGNQLQAGSYSFAADPAGKVYSIRVTATGSVSGAITQPLMLSRVAPEPGSAASIVGVSDPSETAYAADVENNDLLTGLTGTHLNYNFLTGLPGPQINDGLYGGVSDTTAITWANDGNLPSSTYELGVGNGAGYDISRITSFAGWTNAGFMNQKYKISVRYAGGTVFVPQPDCSVDFQPFPADTSTAGSTKVVITRDGGKLFHGITAIRFNLLDTISVNNGGMTVREIDVDGAPAAVTTADLKVTSFSPSPLLGSSNFMLTWQSVAGATYRVEVSSDLVTWTALQASLASGGASTSYADTTAVNSSAKRFYRVTRN